VVTKDEMLVTLVTVLVTISSPGMAFKILCLVKPIGPFFVFLGAISDCNAGFTQWRALVETLQMGTAKFNAGGNPAID